MHRRDRAARLKATKDTVGDGAVGIFCVFNGTLGLQLLSKIPLDAAVMWPYVQDCPGGKPVCRSLRLSILRSRSVSTPLYWTTY